MAKPRISTWTTDRLPPLSVTGKMAATGNPVLWNALIRLLAWRSPHTTFLLGKGAEAYARALSSGCQGDFFFVDECGAGGSRLQEDGTDPAPGRLHRLSGKGGAFDFSGYIETMDMAICIASDEERLLQDSMHAFRILRPTGTVVWITPDPIPVGLNQGFETISQRFPLIRLSDAGGLTFHAGDVHGTAQTQAGQNGAARLSVIVPTCNGSQGLSRTIRSVLDQSLSQDRYEVIVVDNNSSDSTRAVVEEFNQAWGNRIRYIFEPTPGLVYARHAGARAAIGEILCYIDDDATADPAWLEAIARTFENPAVVLSGGKILPEYETEPPDWVEGLWTQCASGRNLGALSLMDLGDEPGPYDPGNVWGCNFSIRKQTLFSVGGFHPDALPMGLIRYRGDGEGGLSRKIGERGYKAYYQPEAVVRHHIPASRLTGAYFLKRQFNQGISDSFSRIRENGVPEDARIHARLLETLKGFVRHLASAGPAEEDVSAEEMNRRLREAYEFGRLFHLFHLLADPDLGDYVRKPNYFSPDSLKPVDLESIVASENAGGTRWLDDYRYGLWLMNQGLYFCARIVLDQVKADGGVIHGLDFSRAYCLAQHGQEMEAEQAALGEPSNSPYRDGAQELLKQIKGDRVRRRTEMIRSLPADSLDVAQMPQALGMAVIYITEMCNSRCITCNSWRNRTEARLDTATWKGLLGQICGAGISSVAFVGGEPLLRPDLPELVAEAKSLGCSTILISTNGFLLDESRTDALMSAGANSFHLSLDGSRETYSRIRGRDWFDRVVQSARCLSRKGADLLLLTILMRQNFHELEQIVAFAHGIGAKWFPNILENGKYLFKGVDTRSLMISDRREIDLLAGKLNALKAQYPQTIDIGKPEIDYIRNYLEDPQWESRIPCTLGFDTVYLDPAANLYPSCMSLKPVGNLTQSNLAELLRSETMKKRLSAMVRRRCPGCTCGYPQRAQDAFYQKWKKPLKQKERFQPRYGVPEENRCSP